MSNKTKVHVYAIVRIDEFLGGAADLAAKVTVTKVVWDQEAAEKEVVRLNALKEGRGSIYFWQLTRLMSGEAGTGR